MEEEKKIEATENSNGNENAMANGNEKDKEKCHRCGNLGHWARDCQQPRNNANGNEKKHGKKINYSEKYVKKLSAEEEAKLDAARIQEFAEKLVNTESDTLHVYVDGYNIIGVDRACRDFMYKSKQKQKARQRIAELIQHSFVEKVKLNYKVVVHLYFDGHIDKEYTKQLVHDEQLVAVYKDIEIVHTTVECVVDDRLVADFSKVAKEQNGDKLVITSDRELTIRLHDIGVASMKSGVFYKAYLAENHDQIDQK